MRVGKEARKLLGSATWGYLPVFVVDLVAVAGGVDNVETELHAILDNDWRPYEDEGLREDA